MVGINIWEKVMDMLYTVRTGTRFFVLSVEDLELELSHVCNNNNNNLLYYNR